MPITVTAQLPEIHKSIIALHDEVMNYVQHSSVENFDPPPPPTIYFDYCFPCDKERQAIYVRDSINFMNACMGEDSIYMNKANAVLNFFANRRLYRFAYDTVKGQQMESDMLNAKIAIAQRLQARLVVAWKKYYSQDEKIPFLVFRMMDQHRINALWGIQSVSGMHNDGILLQLLTAAQVRILEKAKKELDYRILLNLDFINDVFRRAEILEMGYGNMVMSYINQNQFLFTIETKAKVKGTDGGHYSASLSSKQIFAARAGRDCHLKWVMGDEKEKLHYQLNDINFNPAKGQSPLYVGGKEFSSPQPQIKLDFCDNKRDTAHFYGFSGGEKWEIKGNTADAGVALATYMLAFPDNRQYSEFQRGGVVTTYASPFGFYVKQVPWNYHKVILEKTVYSKDVSSYSQYVDYGEFKLKIEHIDQ